MRYHFKTIEFIGNISDFDKNDFEAWLDRQPIMAGGNNVFQYIDERMRWNTTAVVRDDVHAHVELSGQAQVIINTLIKFDVDDFKRWFANSVEINIDTVLVYLEYKKKEVKQNGNSKL